MISQLPTDQWFASTGEKTLADAILDRIMHNAHRLQLKGKSMRSKVAKSVFTIAGIRTSKER